MSNAQTFIAQSLGACGFAVIRGQIAYTQRPDLWATASDATFDFLPKNLNNRMGTVIGCQTYLARFPGIDGLVKVLARSPDALAQRLAWVTGFAPTLLIHESEMAGERDLDSIPPRKNLAMGASTEGGDLYPDLVTAEPGRTCSSCEWATAGSGCKNFLESGIQFPALNQPRRCVAYRPVFSSHDGRLGTVLWPELATLTNK